MGRLPVAIACGLLAILAVVGAVGAKDSMLATLDKPATVTATTAPATMLGAADIGSRHVLLTVVAFIPPPDRRPVEVVVTAAKHDGGASREIGRFALTPYVAFSARDVSMAQRFALSLPADLAGEQAVTLSVALVPVNGGGHGARLELGAAAIQ